MTRHRVFIVLVSLGISACTTSRFQAHVAGERWLDAAEAFTADSALWRDPEVLFAAGLLFATPGRPTYDPERARDLLGRLAADHPGSARSREAAALLPLLDHVVALRAELRLLREIDLQPLRPSRAP